MMYLSSLSSLTRILSIIFVVSILLSVVNCSGNSGVNSVSDPAAVPAPAAGATVPEGYTLAWSEEFSGTTLDATNTWNYDTGYGPIESPGWGNDESQLYTSSADNVGVIASVEGDDTGSGYLYITARCDSGTCVKRNGSITSARITTKDKYEFKYGVAQARIKIPNGKSVWAAFWMLGDSFPETIWPAAGEIDIMETFWEQSSTDRIAHFAMHWQNPPSTVAGQNLKSATGQTTIASPAPSLSDDFHTYELDWNADRIIGKVDGVTYFTQQINPAEMEEFQRPFFFLLNIAIDGMLGLPPEAIMDTPQTMFVDWIRVYGPPSIVVFDDAIGEQWDNGIRAFTTDGDRVCETSAACNNVDWEIIDDTDTARGKVIQISHAVGTLFAVPFIQSSDAVDLTAYVNGDIIFDIKITALPDTISDPTFDMQIGCSSTVTGGVCTSGRITLGLADGFDVTSREWQTVTIPVSRITGMTGLLVDASFEPLTLSHLNRITTGLEIFPTIDKQSGVVFQLDNIRWTAPAPSSGGDDGVNLASFESESPAFTSIAQGAGEIVDNPDSGGINTSAKVAQIVKNAGQGQPFSSAFFTLSEAVDIDSGAVFTVKVYAARAVSVDFKLEVGSGESVPSRQVQALYTTPGEWQELRFDLSGITTDITGATNISLFFDLANPGRDPAELFYFDDVFQVGVSAPEPSSDGVNLAAFESGDAASHGVEDFGGGVGAIVDNPNSDSSGINPSTKVLRIIKNAGPVYSSSSFLLPEAVDISSSAVFTVDIYATRAVPVTFKLELDGSNSRQIEAQYTTPGAWQKLTFDLSGVSGNVVGAVKIAVFFDIENSGSGGDDWTFYFDNVIQVGESEPETPVDTSAGLLINSDFETGDLTGWEDTEGGDMATDEQANGDGMYSAKLTVPAMQGNTIKQTVLNGAADAIAEGEMFTLSLDVRGSIGNTGAVRVVILFETGPAARMELEVFTASIDSWESKTYTITAPAGVVSGVAGGVTVQLETACGGACEVTAFFDNVVLSRVELATTPTMAAPTPPTRTLSNVMSLFSEAYTDATTSNFFAFNGAGTTHEQIMVASASNTVLQYTALNYAGIGFEGANAINAASMTHFHIDIWTPDATGFAVELVDFGGGTASVGKSRTVISADTTPPLIQGEWISVDVRLDNLMTAAGVAFTALDDLNQIVLDGIPDGVTVYLDNIYFYIATTPIQPAPTPPARAAENVISIYSDAYTPATGTIGFSIRSSTGTIVVETNFADDDVQRLIDAVDLSIEGFSSIDLTTPTLMTHFHMDFWTADFDSLEYGLSDGGGDGSDTTDANLHSITTLSDSSNPPITQGSWVSIDVPLSEIIASVESGDTLTATPTDLFRIYLGDISLGTIYIDNIYFYADVPPSGIDGGFESGAFTDAWEVTPRGGEVTVSDERANGGTYSAKLSTVAARDNVVIKLANYLAGTIAPGNMVTVSFDYLVTAIAPGSIFQGRLQVEQSVPGASSTHQYNTNGNISQAITTDWVSFTETTTIPSGDASGGISVELNAVTGGDGGEITVYIDNVVVTVN